MSVAVITGSGTYALPGVTDAHAEPVDTPYGVAEVSRGRLAGAEILHVSRHGAGHPRMSNLVDHRSCAWALRELGAEAAIGCTACGAADPSLELGSLVVFDDLHFPSNRLPDGSLCTFFDRPGDPARGHWILHGGPFSEDLREVVTAAAGDAGLAARGTGTYGHVDGPRFNTPSEIAALATCGVTAVSQTGGPETVLCGELELPYALVGFITDYANEVQPGEPTPVATLLSLMGQSTGVFGALLEATVRRLSAPGTLAGLRPGGTMYRFESE